ncbi:hypothetical protein BBG47_14905 [Paenibacillus sp. KS1]|uniref:hypothetical protein n=1 Tax=Paenibacillus sp. KS1 TaxID=1849249 RepID=UPI00080653D2|nr:hypothetical protein [Paenibacillus sp. KS1]OBY78768.1 hypothetical protein BBG47_14905 [Paenibacillus sp. KS1]
MKKIRFSYILLAIIVAFAVFAYFFIPNPLIQEIAVSGAILYFAIMMLLLRIRDDREQPDRANKKTGIYSEFYRGVYIGFGIVLGINFFIHLFADDETMKITSRVFTCTYAAILGIFYLTTRNK